MAFEIGVSTALTNAVESAANTETVVGTVNIPNVGGVGQSAVVLIASITVTPGASIASVTLRWRRASLTGALVRSSGALLVPAPAASLSSYQFVAADVPQPEPGGLYVLTYQGASEGGAATFNSFHGAGIAA